VNVVSRALVTGAVWTVAVSAAAQNTERAAPTAAQMQARQQIAAFEAALENAVRYGTQMLDQRLQQSSAANMVMLAGMPRARGFRLDDYGVMFDVEFPSMRRSMVWSLQELERTNTANANAALRTAQPGSGVQPREIYQSEITDALLNVILDYTGALGIGPGEWLTVAARETVVDRRFVNGGVIEAPMTVILRMKGSDLQALREHKLSRDEVRTKVDVRHY
jgi:hypothetical protein